MHGMKERVRSMLDDPRSEYFRLTNSIIIVVALLSLLLALAAFFTYFDRYEHILFFADWIITLFFTFEYALRFWIAERKWAYVRSPLGLIDLASFVPTYLGLGSFGFLKTVRFLRIARLSRVANVTNIAKVVPKKE